MRPSGGSEWKWGAPGHWEVPHWQVPAQPKGLVPPGPVLSGCPSRGWEHGMGAGRHPAARKGHPGGSEGLGETGLSSAGEGGLQGGQGAFAQEPARPVTTRVRSQAAAKTQSANF